MASFKFIFPCGHEQVIEGTEYVKGMRHCGQRPTELHITGDVTTNVGKTLEEYYDWQGMALHPYKGILTHDGKVVRGGDE